MSNRKLVPVGKMDRLIAIHAATVVQSSTGNAKPTYSLMANGNMCAAMEILSVREKGEMGQPLTEDLRVFQTHFREDIKTTHRLYLGNVVYDILGIEEVGRRQQIAIYAKAVK